MHPILFQFGSHQIHFYSVFYPLAVGLGIWLSSRRARIEGFDEDRIIQMFVAVMFSMIVGSRLLDVIVRFPLYVENPKRFWSFTEGVVFYGGYLGAIVGGYVFLRAIRHPFLPVLDICATYMGLGLAIHRSLACFMAGCCYGRPTTVPWGVVFPPGSIPAREYGQLPLHPAQLYEAGLGLIIFFSLLAWRKRRVVYGELFTLHLYLYAVGRFIIEFFRGDSDRGHYVIMSTSQWISVALFAAAVGLTLFLRRRRRLLAAGKIQPEGISQPHRLAGGGKKSRPGKGQKR